MFWNFNDIRTTRIYKAERACLHVHICTVLLILVDVYCVRDARSSLRRFHMLHFDFPNNVFISERPYLHEGFMVAVKSDPLQQQHRPDG